jgi:protein-L-isoaspartate(D-aspartate) O-methyltransferase
MSWRCGGSTNDELVTNLVRAGRVTHKSAIFAMRSVDRALFVPADSRRSCYDDHPVSIGFGATISAPHMHAWMLDLVAPHLGAGSTALDVGSGSGYIVACLARMGAKVFGVEHVGELVARSIEAVLRAGLSREQFEIRQGDGRQELAGEGPFDVIHVGAAAQPEVAPVLMRQLKPHGVLAIPIDEGHKQSLYKYWWGRKGKMKTERISGVRFVPLTDAPD